MLFKSEIEARIKDVFNYQNIGILFWLWNIILKKIMIN